MNGSNLNVLRGSQRLFRRIIVSPFACRAGRRTPARGAHPFEETDRLACRCCQSRIASSTARPNFTRDVHDPDAPIRRTRVIFGCWQTRAPNDEVKYLESLRRKGVAATVSYAAQEHS